MHRAVIVGFLCWMAAPVAWAQSTISDRPWELSYASGPWGVLLPSYQLGTDAAGATAFQDDGDTLGTRWELQAIRRFLGTRTSLETKLFYGWAEANSSGSELAIPTLANPANGVNTPLAAGQTHLENGLNHYGIDVALRDTWRTQFGGLSLGAAFSYLAYDQEYQLERNGGRLLTEQVDSDLLGGKAIFGWDGCVASRRSKLDVAVGYYDLDVDYEFQGSAAVPGALQAELADNATSVEANFTTYSRFRGFDTGVTFGVMYLSDYPQLLHNPGNPAELTTEDAVFISLLFQVVL